MPISSGLPPCPRRTILLSLALTLGVVSMTSGDENKPAGQTLPAKIAEMPEGLTSFGAAVIGKSLYIYGGHTGTAHDYSTEDQSGELRRLDLENPSGWQVVAKGPRLQGLALVAHGEVLYRLGGFTAKNKPGEKQDLWSQDDVAAWDPAAEKWETLTPLPEPRSSFDAAVVGDRVYVVGGWSLQGPDKTTWSTTAWSADLTQRPLKWDALPKPPFERRALALAEHNGKLYVIGGMQSPNAALAGAAGPTTRVDIYDPHKKAWLGGPKLEGEPMEGFGASAFAANGKLYVSTYQGRLQVLQEEPARWTVTQTLQPARFFHRMVPSGDQLLLVGGANMGSGKILSIEALTLK